MFAYFLIGLFISLLLSFKGFSYILNINSFSAISFANIFSQTVACLLILLTLPFAKQSFLTQWNPVYYFFMDCVFDLLIDWHYHTQVHLGFLLCYLLGLFIALHFIFRSVIHLSQFLWKVRDLRLYSFFFFSGIWMSSCSSTICWKDYRALYYCLCSCHFIKDLLLLFNCSVVSDSFATPWIAAHQASLSLTISWSLLKLMSIGSVKEKKMKVIQSCLTVCEPMDYTVHEIL